MPSAINPMFSRLGGNTRNKGRTVAALWAAATIAGGLTACGQDYEATATINQFTGPSAFLPPGLSGGSTVSVLLDLAGSYNYQQDNSSDLIIDFPAATFSFSAANGSFNSSGNIQGVTVFFSGNYLGTGETVFEAQAANGSQTFDIGFSKPAGSSSDNSVASLDSFLGSGMAGIINSSLQLDFNNFFGQSGAGADPLGSFAAVPAIPEPRHTGLFSGLGMLSLALVSCRKPCKMVLATLRARVH